MTNLEQMFFELTTKNEIQKLKKQQKIDKMIDDICINLNLGNKKRNKLKKILTKYM